VIDRPDYGLLIRDRTQVDPSGDEARRGAEIGAIFTVDAGGNPVDHASTVVYRPGAGLDGESHLDGSPVDLDETGRCVTEPPADRTTPLGGGDLLVELPDETGDTTIGPGERIAIVEWAADNCGDSEGDADEYDVALCVSETDSLGVDDCEDPFLESATGYIETAPRSDN